MNDEELENWEYQSILKDLESNGIKAEDLWNELRLDIGMWKAATPTLVKWLPKVKSHVMVDIVVRLLTVPWLKGSEVMYQMIDKFKNDLSGNRWTIGNALDVIADGTVFNELRDLIEKEEYGRDREMLVYALGKMKGNPEVVEYLKGLLNDEDLAPFAISALKKLKAADTLELIRLMVDSPTYLTRVEAKKAVKSLEKVLEKTGHQRQKGSIGRKSVE
jgi:hypothetical protein